MTDDGISKNSIWYTTPRSPSTLWHLDFVICMSTRRIFDERASERATTTRQWKYVTRCFHNILSSLLPSVTPPPHTNVAISRSADDDDMMTSKQQSGNGQNKTQQTVKGCSVWYRSPHRNKQYTSILYIHHDRYILLCWPVIVWKDDDGRVYYQVVGRNQTMMKMACRGVSTKHAVLLLLECREGETTKQNENTTLMRHTKHGRLTTNYYDRWSLAHNK